MSIRIILKVMIAILTVWLAAGCSGTGKKGWLRDRSEDYVNAQSSPAIQIPAGLRPEPFSDEYQITAK